MRTAPVIHVTGPFGRTYILRRREDEDEHRFRTRVATVSAIGLIIRLRANTPERDHWPTRRGPGRSVTALLAKAARVAAGSAPGAPAETWPPSGVCWRDP